jgi:phenylpropionate dioxygenase-like ring-hydroxylating dioxygenase large terminal subunit
MGTVTASNHQSANVDVHQVGINPNHWYPVGWASSVKPGQVIPIVIWQRAIALYRDTSGSLHAVEDACPHRKVSLHKGVVSGEHLVCRYHGWEFNGQGECVKIPYLDDQRHPCPRIRAYPVHEKYGIVWLFPGDPALASDRPILDMPEFSQPGLLDLSITAIFNAHFSFCNENSMDMFHGFLHQDLQGWFNPVLLDLQESEGRVMAEYQVSYKGRMANFLGITDPTDEVTTARLQVEYCYPHFRYTVPGVGTGYLLRCPISPTRTHSISVFFAPVRLPRWFLKPTKPLVKTLVRQFVFRRFLNQDIEMIESEQQNYLDDPGIRQMEINPAVIAARKLILRQAVLGAS